MPHNHHLQHAFDTEDEEPSINLSRLVGVLIRRRWLILGTTYITLAVALAILHILPNHYISEATIFAVQPRVPERYVVPTTTYDLREALEVMVQEVLSRPRLLSVIEELNLYPRQRKSADPDRLVQLVRNDVKIQPLEQKLGNGSVNAFTISFEANDPNLAQAVTRKLTTLFIEENLRTRADQAATTTGFLHEQLEEAKGTLQEQEQRLRDFKMQYLGELPEQQQSNLTILSGLETQLNNIMLSRTQTHQQRSYLQSLMTDNRRRDLNRLEAEKAALLKMYTLQHPSVVQKEQEIHRQQTLVESAQVTGSSTQNASGAAEDNATVLQLINQLQANALEIESLSQKEQKLRKEIDQYRVRVNLTPVREQQLAAMQRDYDLVRQHYGDLLKKEQESKLATNLEKRQEGQQFRLADPPNLPTRAASPKRLLMSLVALLGGGVIGTALAFVVELRNSSFLTEEEAVSLSLPIVVGIPLFLTVAERQKRTWRKHVEVYVGFILLSTALLAEYVVAVRS